MVNSHGLAFESEAQRIRCSCSSKHLSSVNLHVALAGVNIIDRDRLWWPSISTSGPLPEYGWTHPRQIGFCAYTLLSEAAEVLVVEDASKDFRYHCTPRHIFCWYRNLRTWRSWALHGMHTATSLSTQCWLLGHTCKVPVHADLSSVLRD